MFYYKGNDPNLKGGPYCFACHCYDDRTVVTELKRCSRCQAAWYCSGQCQKRHFKDHRSLCKRIGGETDIVELMTFPLQHLPLDDDSVGNLFETHLGEFGAVDVAHDYLEALSNLANSYWNAAYEWEVREIWEKSLFYYLELLRVDVAHQCETRFRVPFILLYLNRDDDAYCFIRYWLNFGGEDDDEILARHARSREGDWLYPVERNCRYNDLLEECPKEDELKFTLPYMVVLAIIKLRILASHDAIARTLDFVFLQTEGRRIQEVRPMVHEILAGSDAATQRQQLNRILDRIQHGEPSIFRAILEYEHISETSRAADLYDTFRSQSFSLNDFILLNGLRSFCRVPGATDILRVSTEMVD